MVSLIRTINVNWQGLQNLFRQQYSKLGNTGEQLFHAWTSFSFDENAETLDAYLTCNRRSSYSLKLWRTTNSRHI